MTRKTQRGGRKLGVAFAAVALLGSAALGWGLYWSSTAAALRAAIESRADAPPGDWRIAVDRPDVTGFPFNILVRLRNLEAQSPFGWSWRADRVDVAMRPWRIGQARFNIAGRHVAIPPEGPAGAYELAARRGDGDVAFDADRRVARFRLRLGDAAAILPSGQAASAASVRIDLARGPDDALAIDAQAEAVALTAALAAPLGPTIDALALRALVSDAEALADLNAWRAAGGRATVENVLVDTPEFELSGRGAGTIDAEGQLAGRLETRIRPPSGFIDTLARQGIASPDAAAGAKILFALLGDEAAAPLTALDGALYIGPARIADAPVLLRDDAAALNGE